MSQETGHVDEAVNRKKRRRINRKEGVTRSLEQELEEPCDSDPDPDGSLGVLRLDTGRAMTRWRAIETSLASLQGHRSLNAQAPWTFWELWSGSGNFTEPAGQGWSGGGAFG